MSAPLLLRAVLTALGAVALVAGVFGALTGVGGMGGEQVASVDVDSELRFLNAVWAGFGAACLWLAPRAARYPAAVRALAAVLFLAGLARLISWIDVGRPDAIFLVLMAFELGLPPVMLAAQRRSASA